MAAAVMAQMASIWRINNGGVMAQYENINGINGYKLRNVNGSNGEIWRRNQRMAYQ